MTFGDYRLDIGQRTLWRGRNVVHLGPKAFDLLRLLIEHCPNVVTKRDMMAALWPDTYVTEGNVATLVRDLRAVLRDDPRRARFIRTVHGVGYAFAAVISDPSAKRRDVSASRWRLVWGERELPLRAGENIIGRPGDGVTGVDAPTVSRQHARIVIAGDDATVEDLGSKNGTWLGEAQVTTPAALKDGDRVRLGSVLLTARRRSAQTSTMTMAVGEVETRDPPPAGRRRTST